MGNLKPGQYEFFDFKILNVSCYYYLRHSKLESVSNLIKKFLYPVTLTVKLIYLEFKNKK